MLKLYGSVEQDNLFYLQKNVTFGHFKFHIVNINLKHDLPVI